MTAAYAPKSKKIVKILERVAIWILSIVSLALPTFATAASEGTTSSAITDVGTALTGIMGYISGVTSTILGDDLWIFGMGFFVLSFIAGLVMYFFRVGRR